MAIQFKRGIFGAAAVAMGLNSAAPAIAEDYKMVEMPKTQTSAAFAEANVTDDAAIGACIARNLEATNDGSHVVRTEDIKGFTNKAGTKVVNAAKLIMGDQSLADGGAVAIRPIETGDRAGEVFIGIGREKANGFNADYYAFIGKDGSFSDLDGKPLKMFAEMNPGADAPMPDPDVAKATVTCMGMKGPGD